MKPAASGSGYQYLHFCSAGWNVRYNHRRVESSGIHVAASADIARETIDVIHRPKFNIPEDEIKAIADDFLRTAEFVTPEAEINIITIDLTYNHFLEAALAGNADPIVSGDSHFLERKEFRNRPIITAREFTARLEGE